MSDHPLPNAASSDPDWEAIARYLAGGGSAEERRELEGAIQAHPDREKMLAVLGRAIQVPNPAEPTKAEVELALASVLARRDREIAPASAPKVVSMGTYRTRRSLTAWRAAAAVIVVAGAGFLLRNTMSPRTAPQAARQFASAVGAIDSVTLSDGTRVLLGPGSEITVASGYGSATRELTLVGEARFNVRHDTSHPFIVHTGAATFRDIGTVFSVHSDLTEGARIVVSEGAVSVEGLASNSAVTLFKGDRAEVTASGKLSVERATLAADDTAWTRGKLVFHDAPVAQVVADVRRWYGIDVRVDSTLLGHHVSAEFDRNSAADVGRVIAALLGGGFRQDGSTLYIVPAPAGATPK